MLSRIYRPVFPRQLPIVAAFLLGLTVIGGSTPVSGQVLDSSVDRFKQQFKAKKAAKPYEITSRIHLAKGSTEGYLVVQVKLKKGSHIYSLTQSGNVPPTKLTLAPSKQLRLTGTFTPDSPAKVIAKDPGLGQRVEKHTGTVQFFAPIQVAPNTDVKKLVAAVQFDGQVCTADSCVPVRRYKTQSKFSGFFDQTPKKGSVEARSAAAKAGGSSNWPLKK